MNSYSQAGQDLFVHRVIPHITGMFLDIGCAGLEISNTLGLEEIGWGGILVDSNPKVAEFCRSRKRSTFILADASKAIDITLPSVVEYLSLDVDEAINDCLDWIPFAKTTFGVITLEHNLYYPSVYPPSFRDHQRRLLRSLGYDLLCADVMNGGMPFEDWWVYPGLVNRFWTEPLRCESKEWRDILGV